MSKKAHFVGIAGKGMSAAALLLRETGWSISGSDEGFYPPVSEYLAKAGIVFANGYAAENIPADADVIVVGKNAKLTKESNLEVAAAFNSGKTIKSFPDILEELTVHTDNIVVAGSYGKSTTTALLAHCLVHAGKDPSYFIGEIVRGFGAHAHVGKGGVFVLEGDEYPSAHWDPRSKFLHYNPHTVLLTSATHDHINIYPTHEEYLAPFRKLMNTVRNDGLVVANADEPFAKGVAEVFAGKKVWYGMHAEDAWHPTNIVYGMPTTFDLIKGAEKIVTLTTTQLGAHNVENIVGASALLLEKGLVTPEELQAAVAEFKGVKRRMELLTEHSVVPVLEGFGSSVEKAMSAIAAMRLHYPTRRLVVVFEPHTFTWRNRTAIAQYDRAFAGAARVYIYEPATQGATTHEQLTQEEIVARVHAAGVDAVAISDPMAAVGQIVNDLAKDDVVLLLSSGNLGGMVETIPHAVEEKFTSV